MPLPHDLSTRYITCSSPNCSVLRNVH